MPHGDVFGAVGDIHHFTILNLLRSGREMTRPELIAETSLGRRVVTQRVGDLIASGLVAETSPAPSSGGRPPAQVRFEPSAAVVLVAEISPSVIRVGCCDLAARLLEWTELDVPSEETPESVLHRVEASWDDVIARRALGPDDIAAIGIGVIGPVDLRDDERSSVATPYGWDGARVRSRLAERYGVPVWADNEVNMMAVGEYRLTRRDSTDFILVLIDAGIGAGLIVDGRLMRGSDGIAGELGHVRVSDDVRRRCWCGRAGCLTQVASGAAIERAARGDAFEQERSWQAPRLQEVIDAARSGDPDVAELFRAAGTAAGRVLADLVTFVNPTEIVIGGRVPTVGGIFLDPLREALETMAFPASVARLKLSVSTHEEQLGLVGAGIVAIDGYLSPRHSERWLRHRSRR